MSRLIKCRLCLTACLTVMAVFGPAGSPQAAQDQWQGDVLQSSATADLRVARSLWEWKKIWETLEQPAPPTFTEGRDMAVIIEGEKRPTAGYAINIIAAEKKGLFLVIHWRDQSPPPGAYVPQVISHPWSVKKLEMTDMPVVFLNKDDTTFAIPRREYFRFKTAFPQCAAGLDRLLRPEASVYLFDRDVIAPFLLDSPACANQQD